MDCRCENCPQRKQRNGGIDMVLKRVKPLRDGIRSNTMPGIDRFRCNFWVLLDHMVSEYEYMRWFCDDSLDGNNASV